jgi:serine/threonine-protein kinase
MSVTSRHIATHLTRALRYARDVSEAPLPVDEARRLEALASCRIVGTEPEPEFDDIAQIAARLCGTPLALVTFIDESRQWFKAKVGIAIAETPRKISFCAHALEATQTFVVRDATLDPRFADNPFVTGEPRVRFYAGVPIRVDHGSAVGTLCVLDYVARDLEPAQLASLESLARHVARELTLRSELSRAHASHPPGNRLAPGDRVGRFRVVGPIGEGGLGAVYEAKDEAGERVAIKYLLPQWASLPEIVERFAREARVLAELRSPNTTRIVDVGNLDESHDELPYIAMEYLEGEDLRRVLARDRRVDWRDAAAWIADACDGLAEAHALGVVHRDLKPANLFRARRDGKTITKVLDFGIARVREKPDELTHAGTVMGSMRYMPPEQMLARDIDARGDVWSLGVILHELVSGARPFDGASDMQICVAVLQKDAPALEGVPDAYAAVVSRCLAKAREDRFETAAELGAALRALL